VILTAFMKRLAPNLHNRLKVHPRFTHFDRAVTVMVFFDLFPRFWTQVVELTVVIVSWAQTLRVPTTKG
jgi:hypothetical protein